MATYTDKQLSYINKLVDEDFTWAEVTDSFNHEFNESKTPNAIRKTYNRFQNLKYDESTLIDKVVESHRTKKRSAKLAKENLVILDYLSKQDEMLTAFKDLVEQIEFSKIKIIKHKKERKKRNMTMEALLSDVHFGKRGNESIKGQLQKFTRVIVEESERHSKLYNVEKIILACLGDLVENQTFHGIESANACYLNDSEQEVIAIETIFTDIITPLALTGRKIVIPCITGNHDRRRKDKTYVLAGKDNRTWTIYKVLEMLAKKAKFKNVEFIIPEKTYCSYSIYGSVVLYEHGDECGKGKVQLENQISKRSKQIGSIIDFLRVGHWHEYCCFDRGRIIINGSPCLYDSYADTKGYNSQPCQVINYYIETKSRPDSFYTSFPVSLSNIEGK